MVSDYALHNLYSPLSVELIYVREWCHCPLKVTQWMFMVSCLFDVVSLSIASYKYNHRYKEQLKYYQY